MKQLTNETIIQRNPDLLATALDDELVMMSIEKGEYYALNSIAKKIWQHIENKISLTDLFILLENEYDVDTRQCQEEVKFFLNELNSKNMIIVF